jgi:hypothetical protein
MIWANLLALKSIAEMLLFELDSPERAGVMV